MRIDVFTQLIPAPTSMFLVGFGLICLSAFLRRVIRNLNVLYAQFFRIQHALNPLHVYCRLVDRGLSKKLSMSICKFYGIIVYSWLSWDTVVVVKTFRLWRT
jgi:hypothetical protein